MTTRVTITHPDSKAVATVGIRAFEASYVHNGWELVNKPAEQPVLDHVDAENGGWRAFAAGHGLSFATVKRASTVPVRGWADLDELPTVDQIDLLDALAVRDADPS